MTVAGPDPADTLRIEVPWTLTSGREGVNGETSVPNVKVYSPWATYSSSRAQRVAYLPSESKFLGGLP